jgi:C-terminal processing protease CtpA/Prc
MLTQSEVLDKLFTKPWVRLFIFLVALGNVVGMTWGVGQGQAERPHPLTARSLENLVAYTRLLGYVRYFHPSDEAAKTDWNTFAIEGIKVIEPAKNATELAQKLETLFHAIAPTVRVFPTGQPSTPPQALLPPLHRKPLRITFWQHYGLGLGAEAPTSYNYQTKQMVPLSPLYHSDRVSKDVTADLNSKTVDDLQHPFIAALGGGISCSVPLRLFADNQGTIPRFKIAAMPSVPRPSINDSGNDRATRLADVALAWNTLQHFYPYFDVVQADWQNVLKTALSSAATDPDEKAFLQTLQRLIAALQDGHGSVFLGASTLKGPQWYTLPIYWQWIENQLVITNVMGGDTKDLQIGDIVSKIDGKLAAEAIAEQEVLASSATPQLKKFKALRQLRRRTEKDASIQLEIQTQGGRYRSIVLHFTQRLQEDDLILQEPRPAKIAEVRPNLYYLDLFRISNTDLQSMLPKLKNASGIIFDLRGYPRVPTAMLGYLTDKLLKAQPMLVPTPTKPDRQNMQYAVLKGPDLEPKAPRLKAKIVFLTDGRAISAAETMMELVEGYKLAEIVGEPTAGTNGVINSFVLPGQYKIIWTGMRVLKPDGSQLHGIGIKPTIPVLRTIQGVREHRDEQLERAIAVINQSS